MPEHYPKATVEVSVWCNRCNRSTAHRVDDGRRGPCLECLKKLNDAAGARKDQTPVEPVEPVESQRELFKGGKP